jgi:hypothetical protein
MMPVSLCSIEIAFLVNPGMTFIVGRNEGYPQSAF